MKGYVTDQSRRAPVQDADVNIWNNDDNYWNKTDENGYYEIHLSAGDYQFEVHKEGFRRYYDEKLEVGDNDVIWYNVTLEREVKVWIRGYVTDNATGNPIANEWISFNGGENSYDAETNRSGYYEKQINANDDYEVNMRVNGYMSYNDHIHVGASDMWHNFTLEPLPPTDVHLKGYITSPDHNPIRAMVGAHNIMVGAENGTQTNETGYYEVDVWSGWSWIMAMTEGYYTYFHMEKFTPGEHWYNITIYPEMDANYTLSGYVFDSNGDPVGGADVVTFNQMTGLPMDMGDYPYAAKTKDNGYYEMRVPAGDWYVGVNYEDDNGDNTTGAVKETTINSDTTMNFTLPAPINGGGVNVVFTDWDHATATMRDVFSMDASTYVVRARADFSVGNGDGVVSAGEAALYRDFFSVMMGMHDDGPDSNNTNGDFYVDNIYYDFTGTTVHIMNLTGDITSPEPVRMKMVMTLVSHSPISPAGGHTIKVNVSYEKDDGGAFAITLPPGFTYHNYTATANVTVSGMGTNMTTIVFIGPPVEHMSEFVTLRISGSAVPNQPPIANAGQEVHINAGDTATLTGTGTDTDGTIVLYEWDFDGDGTYDWNSTTTGTATHVYPTAGTYHPVLRVTDNDGATDTDNTTVVVSPVTPPPNQPPIVDAGANLTINAGNTAHFNATASDPDGTIVLYEWDFDGDGVYDYNSTTASTASHTYATAGTYHVVVRVTDNDGATATDGLYVTVNAPSTPAPHLQIESLSLSKLNPSDGDRVTISVTLKNTGNAPAENITVKIFVDGTLKDTIDYGTIGPGAAATRSYNWTAIEGDHTITINMTYRNGADHAEKRISVSGSSGGIPGFEAVVSVGAIGAVLVLFRRKRL